MKHIWKIEYEKYFGFSPKKESLLICTDSDSISDIENRFLEKNGNGTILTSISILNAEYIGYAKEV